MIFHVLTIFPEFFRAAFEQGVVGKARVAGLLEIRVHDLRDWTRDRHRTVDDRPFGGGEGMLLKAGPIFEAVESIWPQRCAGQRIVLLSAQGPKFGQARAREFSKLSELLLICGRYEGVDERVAEHLADEELSIGDYVLSGGELPALVIIDAIARLMPGTLGSMESALQESFSDGLVDWPHYTRPQALDGHEVPAVLASGDHAAIQRWRLQQALGRTWLRRPELLEQRGMIA